MTAVEASLKGRTKVSRAGAHEFPGDLYDTLTRPCTAGSSHGPSGAIEPYMATKNGRAFFHLVKSTALRPPNITEYETYFADFATFKPNVSLLLLEQRYLEHEFAQRIGVDKLNMTGQVVAITGASSGMGLALAIECSKRGATVYGIARGRDIYDWGIAIARSSGLEAYVEAKAKGTAEEAAAALGLTPSAGGAWQVMNFTRPELFYKPSNEWLLPQTYYPIYSGQVGVEGSVLDRIVFDEVDIRSPVAVDRWLTKIRNAHETIDYLCLNAQSEVGPDFTTLTIEDLLAETESDALLTYSEIVAKWPRRQAGTSRVSNLPEFEVGVKYLLARLVKKFGKERVKERTDIQLISSIAGNPRVAFDRNGKLSRGEKPGWSEYAVAKRKGEMLKQLMISDGYRFNTISPTVFNTYINGVWLRYFLANDTGELISPLSTIDINSDDGKFYHALSASTFHDMHVTVLNAGNSTVGGFVGGATYGALQYLGVYMKDKKAPPMQRRTVFLDNPAVYSSVLYSNLPFGASSSDIRQSALCYDPTDAAQNFGYIVQWKVWGPASRLAELWSAPSLTYLTE
eukprot:CAMPEP_0179025142 /NCGR_PEP_ID=MMETSP0796-20121207/7826_1 /TAXON_ID=73915 /ORGANISM="Pyrodinium bahamense, Strain pbaha01" /LENGTH=569 /DNA_ID=CAMNT_0020721141 /DNA_START=84 /DNA_END=1793 /DNA_ORIENTATION=+